MDALKDNKKRTWSNNKKMAIGIVGAVFIIIIQAATLDSNGIAGRTGSPGETTCATSGCHSSFSLNSGPGSTTITSTVPSSGYVAGTTYSVSVIVAQSGFSLFGFGFEALNSSNASAGTLSITNTASTKLQNSGSRVNVVHTLNGGAAANAKTFTFNWTAPATSTGNVTFYAAGNAANKNGNTSGDYIYSKTLVVLPATTTTTITTGSVSGNPYCAGQTGISIPFTATGKYNSGNIFTTQLSSATGSFTTPMTIGTLTSTTSGTIVSSIALPSTAGTQYRIRVISSNPSTSGTDNGSNLTISLPPSTSNAGTVQTICGTSVTLAGNTPTIGSGTWTLVSGSGTISTPSSATSTVTGLGTGANVFKWTISNSGCTASTSNVTITAVASPTTANAGKDQTVCGTSATLAGNTPTVGSGTWTLVSGSGTISTPSNATSTVTSLGTGANVFKWSISNSGCTTSTSNVTITAVASPTTANAGPDQTACTNSTTLAGNAAVEGTGTWTIVSGSGTFTNANSPTTAVTNLGTGSNTFRWTISNVPCTASSDNVIVTQAGSITASNAGPDQTICSNSSTLAGNTPVIGTGAWSLISGTGTVTTPANPTSTVTNLGVGQNTFRWTISNASCAPSIDDIIITIKATPTTANAGPNQPVCTNQASLAGNTPSIGTGTWTLISGNGTITTPSSPTSTVTNIGIGANTFRWTIANAPCASSSDDIIITQSGTITTANAGVDQTICSTSATLSGNTATSGIGTWTLVSGSGTITTPSSASSTVTGLGKGSNTFRWTISNASCTPSTDDVIINSTSNPTTANAGTNQKICSTSATLSGNTPTTGTGLWTVVSGIGTITNPTNPSTTITSLGNGTSIFTWTISNAPCAGSSSNVTINNCTNNIITTSSISGDPFCFSTSYSVLVNFTTTGIFSSYFTAELSDANGSFTNSVVIGSSSTSPISAVIPAASVAGTNYRIRVSNSNPLVKGSDNGTNFSINTCATNSITTSVISGSPFCSNTSYSVQVPFISTGTYTGPYKAELSDASGSFSNPLIIGQGTSNPIQATIPSGTASGYTYRIRVVNNSPSVIGVDNGSDLQINTCMAITTGNVTGSPYCSNTSYTLNVPFTFVGSLTGPFIAQLSDLTGSFANPLTIGYGSSSPVFATIPSSTLSAKTYRVRIVDYPSGTTGVDNGANLSVNTCITTGILGTTDTQISLFPNPNNGNFFINPSFSGNAQISILNTLGETIFQESVDTQINVPCEIKSTENISAGVYIIRVQLEDKMYQSKMMIF
jgi:hypothetical protein